MASTSNCFNGFTFSFDGQSSELYGLYMGWRSANEEWSTGLDREIVKADMNMSRSNPNQYGAKYTDPLTLEFDIFHQDGSEFDYRESRHINNWLIKDTYKNFKVNDNNTDNIYYKAICTSIQDVTLGRFAGKHIVMQCDSPFAYMRELVKTIDVTSTSRVRMPCSSDNGAYYPQITIICGANYTGTIALKNRTENRSMTINMANIAKINNRKLLNVDAARMMITNENGALIPLHQLGWSIATNANDAIQSSSLYWFRLLPGDNDVEITGQSKVIFKMSFLRKAGQINEQ